MARYTTDETGRVRDRYASPSINFPQSEEEAFQALLHSARKALFDSSSLGGISALTRTYTTNAGLGTTRTQEQADWLNAQQALVKARFEDIIDAMDLANDTPFA